MESIGRRRVETMGGGRTKVTGGGGATGARRGRKEVVLSKYTGEEVVGGAGCPTPMGADDGREDWGEFTKQGQPEGTGQRLLGMPSAGEGLLATWVSS